MTFATSVPPPDADARRPAELAGWFVRRTGGDWTTADEAAFQQWLAADPCHRADHDRWAADWALIDAMPVADADHLRAMVAADRAAESAIQQARRPVAHRRLATPALALAGVAMMALTGWWAWQQIPERPAYQQAFHTSRGQQAEWTLPDGSLLRLDTATSVKVAYYSQRREVKLLEGQALFSVRPAEGRPFQVAAEAVQVTVVGTRFSVRLTPDVPGRDGVEVAVEQGKVHVARAAAPGGPQGGAPGYDLAAGDQLVYGPQGAWARLGKLTAGGMGWRSGPISFSDVPLKTAIAEMSRYAPLGIASIEPAAADLRLTGTFEPRDPAGTRSLLAHALPVQVVSGTTGYEIRAGR